MMLYCTYIQYVRTGGGVPAGSVDRGRGGWIWVDLDGTGRGGGDGHDEGVVWVCVGMQGVHELMMMMIIVVRVRQGKRDVSR